MCNTPSGTRHKATTQHLRSRSSHVQTDPCTRHGSRMKAQMNRISPNPMCRLEAAQLQSRQLVGGIASRLRQLFPRWVSIYSILGFSRPLHRLDRFFCWFWVPAPTRHLGETWRRHFDDFSTVWTIILASCRWAATTARTLCLDQFMFPASNTQSFPP